VKLGKRLWILWRLRPWVAVSVVFALAVALESVASISLLPPGLTPRALEMATASTHVVVDTPKSSVLDLRQSTDSLQSLTQRAVLLGNVIANGAVREAIAHQAHVPLTALQVAPPLTPEQPTPQPGSYNNSVSSIARSTNQYRLSISANATVPMLDIYAQAPTASAAAVLANSAVSALRGYLARLAAAQGTPPTDQIRLLQLGTASGQVINQGIAWQVALLMFVVAFGLASASAILVTRIRLGWRAAARADQRATA
jgi:hypothetical protein